MAFLGRNHVTKAPSKSDVVLPNPATSLEGDAITLEGLAGASAVAITFAAISQSLSVRFGVPSTVASTLMTVSFATAFPRMAAPLVQGGNVMGRLLLFLFFASIGLSSGMCLPSDDGHPTTDDEGDDELTDR